MLNMNMYKTIITLPLITALLLITQTTHALSCLGPIVEDEEITSILEDFKKASIIAEVDLLHTPNRIQDENNFSEPFTTYKYKLVKTYKQEVDVDTVTYEENSLLPWGTPNLIISEKKYQLLTMMEGRLAPSRMFGLCGVSTLNNPENKDAVHGYLNTLESFPDTNSVDQIESVSEEIKIKTDLLHRLIELLEELLQRKLGTQS